MKNIKVNLPETGNILSEVSAVFFTGKHTGANGASVLKDESHIRSNTAFAFTNEIVGKTIYNLRDGCLGVITSITNETITCSGGLSGGTDNGWDTGDEYLVGERALNVIATIIGTTPAPATQPPPDGYSTIGDGLKDITTAGTREALAASTACKKIEITANLDNVGIVCVGGNTVVAAVVGRRGIPLNQGSNITVYIEDLASVYLDVVNSGDGVTYIYYE